MLYKTKLGMTDELLTCREREIEEDDKCMLICSEIARRKEIQAVRKYYEDCLTNNLIIDEYMQREFDH
jgi:hypothetical protein